MTSNKSQSTLICLLSLVLVCLAATAVSGSGEVDHSPFGSLLREHTRDGLVDYARIKQAGSELQAYIETLSDSSALHYKTWDRDTKIAFWINAYNAVTIHAVVENYPIQVNDTGARKKLPPNSIGHISGVGDTAYVELAGRPVSLKQIEEVLIGEFGDPRVHFALSRATMGGPQLSADPYAADSLYVMLERAAHAFVNDGDKVRVNITRGRLYVSEIFEEGAADFAIETAPAGETPEWLKAYKKKTRGFISFIAPRVDVQTRGAIESRGLKIDYLKYDWSLNELVEED